MISYRDMTFCASNCCNTTCHRFLSPRISADAERCGLPMALSDFSARCPGYLRNTTDRED